MAIQMVEQGLHKMELAALWGVQAFCWEMTSELWLQITATIGAEWWSAQPMLFMALPVTIVPDHRFPFKLVTKTGLSSSTFYRKRHYQEIAVKLKHCGISNKAIMASLDKPTGSALSTLMQAQHSEVAATAFHRIQIKPRAGSGRHRARHRI